MSVPLHRRFGAVVLAIVAHLACLWFLASSIHKITHPVGLGELQVSVFSPRLAPSSAPPPPLTWTFRMPEDIEVPEPIIDMPPDIEGGAAMGGPGQVIPPRPDPQHVNTVPDLPAELLKLASAAVLELRIWVLPDGSVGDVLVLKSSGVGQVDASTKAFVMANWRYIPASVEGRPVQGWATVFVRFGAS
jgi:periplasmic protein TonB